MKTSGGSNRKSALESRLRAWDDVASQAVTRTGHKSRNWRVYTTAVGSALAMATNAGAGIIQSSGPPVTLTAGLGYSFPEAFDIGPAVFDLVGIQFPSYNSGAVRFGAAAKAGMLLNATGGVRKLSSGAKISSGAGAFLGGEHFVRAVSYFGGAAGSFKPGVPAFAGIEFNTGGRGTSNSSAKPEYHYGWVELEFLGSPFPTTICTPECSSGTADSPTEVVSWAYNSVAGQAINAGQTSDTVTTTPEPGTAALSLLALGAAGVLAWRRRKAALSIE